MQDVVFSIENTMILLKYLHFQRCISLWQIGIAMKIIRFVGELIYMWLHRSITMLYL